MTINDFLGSLLSIPPIHWLVQQSIWFVVFGLAVAALLVIGTRGMRGPEV